MKISPVEGLESLRPVGFLVRLPVLELRAVDFAVRKSHREKPRARRLTCLCPVCPFNSTFGTNSTVNSQFDGSVAKVQS